MSQEREAGLGYEAAALTTQILPNNLRESFSPIMDKPEFMEEDE